MGEIVFQNISFKLGDEILLDNISFRVEGFCNIEFETNNDIIRLLRSFFTHHGPPLIQGLSITGEVIINGQSLDFNKLRTLLNRFILFDHHATLRDVLSLINYKEVDSLLECVPEMAERNIGSFSLEETRIVNLLVNIAANPPFIFIDNIELPDKQELLCLKILKRHADKSGTPCLVLSKYRPIFSGTVIVRDHEIITYYGKEAKKRHSQSIIDQFLCVEKESIGNTSELSHITPHSKYDFYAHFAKYKCENLVSQSLHGMNNSGPFFDIFRISFTQTIQLAIRKYNLILFGYNNSKNIYSTLKPFILSIIIARIVVLVFSSALTNDIHFILSLLLVYIFGKSSFSCFVLVFAISKLLSGISDSWIHQEPGTGILQWFALAATNIVYLVRSILLGSSNFYEKKLISLFLYLFVFGMNVSIFEEDRPFFEWYCYIFFTPATYFVSACLYICVSQMLILFLIMKCLSVPCAFLLLHNATVTNFVFACIRSKRMREFFIACFLFLYLIPFLTTPPIISYLYTCFSSLVPPLSHTFCIDHSPLSICQIIYLICFDVVIFLFCTFRLSSSLAPYT